MVAVRSRKTSSCFLTRTKTIPKQKVLAPMVNRANSIRVDCYNVRTCAQNWPPIYIGKESDKHWEEGEDLSLFDFKSIEYKRKGNAVATDEQLTRIQQISKRELMRRGINQHTLEKICSREPVRATKLAKCMKVLGEIIADDMA